MTYNTACVLADRNQDVDDCLQLDSKYDIIVIGYARENERSFVSVTTLSLAHSLQEVSARVDHYLYDVLIEGCDSWTNRFT